MSLCERTGVKVGSKQGSHLGKEVCGRCLMLGPRWVSGPVPAVGMVRLSGLAMVQMIHRLTNSVKCLLKTRLCRCGWFRKGGSIDVVPSYLSRHF